MINEELSINQRQYVALLLLTHAIKMNIYNYFELKLMSEELIRMSYPLTVLGDEDLVWQLGNSVLITAHNIDKINKIEFKEHKQ